jgi:hypothetical protein
MTENKENIEKKTYSKMKQKFEYTSPVFGQ